MTSGKREPDSLTAQNVAYSSLGTFESGSANVRALAGLSDRGAVKIDAANSITADSVFGPVAGKTMVPRRWYRIRSTTSSMPAVAKGCRPDTISYRTTVRDQTSSASSARRPGEYFGQHIAQGAACGHGIVRLTSQAEIQQFRRPVRRKPDIARLDVSMQESPVVQRRQRFGQPSDGRSGLQRAGPDRTAADPRVSRREGTRR